MKIYIYLTLAIPLCLDQWTYLGISGAANAITSTNIANRSCMEDKELPCPVSYPSSYLSVIFRWFYHWHFHAKHQIRGIQTVSPSCLVSQSFLLQISSDKKITAFNYIANSSGVEDNIFLCPVLYTGHTCFHSHPTSLYLPLILLASTRLYPLKSIIPHYFPPPHDVPPIPHQTLYNTRVISLPLPHPPPPPHHWQTEATPYVLVFTLNIAILSFSFHFLFLYNIFSENKLIFEEGFNYTVVLQ